MTEPRVPLRSQLQDALDERDVQRLWRGVQQRRERADERRRQRPVRLLAVGALATSVLAVLLFWRQPQPAPEMPVGALLAVSGQSPDRLSAPIEGREVELPFSDGSQITLKPGAEVEVLENTGSAFVTVLRQGQGRFEVKPGGPRRWSVECGAVTIEVVGTGFTVERSSSRVAVDVHHGIVLVRGEGVPDRVRRLTAGEQFELTVTPPPASHPLPSVETRPLPPAAPRTASAPTTVIPTSPTVDESWRLSALRGDFAAASAHLGATRLRAEIEHAHDLETILLLADVARSTEQAQLAADGLQRGLRERPDDPLAGMAAFTLGVLELEELRRPGEAVKAFERVVSLGRPQSLLEDAQARLVEALFLSGATEELRAAAAVYHQRYPNGRRAQEVRRWADP